MSGCSDDQSTNPALDNAELSSYGTRAITDGGDTLLLDTVKILVKNIKFNVSQSSDSSNFKTGPFVIFLNFSNTVTLMTSAQVPQGSYDKIKFEIHKLEDNETPPDPEFLSGSERYSVIVKGFFNGSYFVYKSSKSAHQILNYPSNVSYTSDTKTNVTIKAEPYKWFYRNGVLLDPNNPSNRNDIDNNIKDNINSALKAFRDNNKDGTPD
jgi:hypothetical protein